MSGTSTGEGIIWAVRDAIKERHPIKQKGRVVGYEDVECDPGVKDKRLERVSPDMEADKVIRRETTWKDRLRTRSPHGLNDN